MEEVLYPKFPPQNSLYALCDCGPKFLSEHFSFKKMVGSHWPTSAASSHLVEPPNGLKQLKMRSQWGLSQAFPLMMIKVILPFIQTKANLKITTCLTPWGPKPFLLTKNQSIWAPQTQYKFHNQIQKEGGCFTLGATPQAQDKSLSSTKNTTSHVLFKNLKLQNQTPLSQSTISQIRTLGVEIWVQGSLPSLPHDLPRFPLLCDCGSKFQTCYVVMLFLHFCYKHFDFLLSKHH